MKLLYPVKGVTKITQHFGENPAIYKQFNLKGHNGLDLRAPNGIEILATDDGTITEVADQGSKGYGKYIKILHSWGESVYAHLQKFKIKKNDWVLKGETIALADNSGFSTGSHLHFGVRIYPYNKSDGWGGYSDPEPYIVYENAIIEKPMNGQTVIPKELLSNWGMPLEIQQVNGLLGDLKRLQSQPTISPSTPGTVTTITVPHQFSNPLARLINLIAQAIERRRMG